MSTNFNPNDSFLKNELTNRLVKLEEYLNADVLSFTGAVHENAVPKLLGIIENLSEDKNKKDALYII